MTLGIQAEDKVDMACVVRAADGGRELWSVSHLNDAGQELTVTGDAPGALADIRRKYEVLQAEEDDADYLWDIPVELARTLTGYRVDEDRIDFIELASTRVKPVRKGGLLARLFSARR